MLEMVYECIIRSGLRHYFQRERQAKATSSNSAKTDPDPFGMPCVHPQFEVSDSGMGAGNYH